MHQTHSQMCDQRRLLRRFGQDGIASGQCGGDLAGKDGQREIPWADASEGADGRALGRIGSVVTQEIHRLAQLGHRIGDGFPGLAGEDRENLTVILLVEVRHAVEDHAPFLGLGAPRRRSG